VIVILRVDALQIVPLFGIDFIIQKLQKCLNDNVESNSVTVLKK